jgi:AcrR family transcriptional regulator
VSVRDIVLAAGQRNSGSLRYYFGTKEDLARELVADGAKLIDKRGPEPGHPLVRHILGGSRG